jgi:hypothetical protein
MQKVSEYERRAAKCRLLAAKTPNQAQKEQLLEMAEAWDQLAQERREQLSQRPINGHRLPDNQADQPNKAAE